MTRHRQPFFFTALYLLIALYVQNGAGQVELNKAIPDSGTTIVMFASDSVNITFFCELMIGESQHTTNWFLLTAERRDEGRNPISVPQNDPQFVRSGDIIVSGEFDVNSNTNLTIVGLTTDLHNSTLFCGADTRLANFTLIVYDNPSPPSNFMAITGETFADILWEPPSNLGSPEVSYYELIVSDENRDTLHTVTVPASGSREFNATGLLPGTNYTASLRAVSQLSPVLVISPAAELEFTTNTSVPLVNCTGTELSEGQTGVRIVWDIIHTGGLSITTATIEYSPLPRSDNNMTSVNFTPVVNASVDLMGSVATLQALPDAGQTYVFRVTTANTEGDSVPSECPPIFLEIGTPSTPDAPIAEANGPLAQLTLRTVRAGVGNPPHSFAFTVLVYSFNSTDNTSELEHEIKGFKSPEYRSGDIVQVRVEEVMQLGQFYQFAAQAVNMFGVSEVSKPSNPIFLNVSTPDIRVVEIAPQVEGLLVSWEFLHTGGLEISQVEIFLRQEPGSPFELVPGGNISRPQNNTFVISGQYLGAGLSYQVAVRVANELGVSEQAESERLDSPVGVPAVPLTPTLFSSTPTSITLNLNTAATGLLDSTETLTFSLRITATDAAGVSQTSSKEQEFPADISGSTVLMTVTGLEAMVLYVFSVRAENRFGQSNYSAESESISVMEDDGKTGGLGTPVLIGIAVGAFILVVMVLLCCLLVVCVLIMKGKSDKTADDTEGERATELQENTLYERHPKNKPQEQEAEFPPGAYESQYEPPTDESQVAPLRPKPTHPTGDLRLSYQPQPLYDSLIPSPKRKRHSASIGSRELPNPLYSGLPSSSRPTSRLHDSGTGTVHSTPLAGSRGNTNTNGGEPLYSEAEEPPPSDGMAVYTEPNMRASRTSQRLNSWPTPPPPPPDPSSIPTYAEAGPGMGSEEHLYSELSNHQPREGESRDPGTRTPVFHLPPPPPPPSNENSGVLFSGSPPREEIHSNQRKQDML